MSGPGTMRVPEYGFYRQINFADETRYATRPDPEFFPMLTIDEFQDCPHYLPGHCAQW